MIKLRTRVALCALAAVVGFGHAALTVDPPQPVQCYEDGSCTDGYCAPYAACDDSGEDVR